MSATYISKIKRYGWSELQDLWKKIVTGKTPGWTAGKALEYLILRAFEIDEAIIRWPYEVRINEQVIEQIDGALHYGGLSCLVECKDTTHTVNIEPIAKLRNQLLRRHSSTIGLLFSRNGFTPPALTLAQFLSPQSILLWNGHEIEYVLKHKNIGVTLIKKYRYFVETGIPDFDIRVEDLP